MKYMLMMHAKKSGLETYRRWSREDVRAQVAFMRAFSRELKDAGVFVSTEGLAFPDQAQVVRAGGDGQPIADGTFPESKEFLTGYWIVDVESHEEAFKIAARASAAPGPGGKPGNIPIEVRQVLNEVPKELL